MPPGDKSSYTAKQKRQTSHIEEGLKRKVFLKKKQSDALGQPKTIYPVAAKIRLGQTFKEVVILLPMAEV